MRVDYIRTSKKDQNPDLQRRELEAFDCEKKLALASKMLKNHEIPVGKVCEAVGVLRSTLYRRLKPDGSVRQAG